MEGKPGQGPEGERPLVTFLLLSYRHERFLREAAEGALAQGYSPLEVILSDDGSPDGSFGILEEVAAAYRGPHRVVLNRNPSNLGIGGHIDRAMERANGELVVMAAGDDVSEPARTERLCREWARTGKGACSLYSDAVLVDEEGRGTGRLFGGRAHSHARTVEEAIARGGIGVAGCTHAFTKECFDAFGPVETRAFAEDMTIPFRSLLLGDIRYLDEPLVRYRTHGGNVSGLGEERPTMAKRRSEAENHAAVYSAWERDVRAARDRGLLSAERAERIGEGLRRRRYWIDAERRYFGSGAVSGLIPLIGSALRTGNVLAPGRIVEKRIRTKGGGRG